MVSSFFGAGSRGQTDTVLLPSDFESDAFANSTIPANGATLGRKQYYIIQIQKSIWRGRCRCYCINAWKVNIPIPLLCHSSQIYKVQNKGSRYTRFFYLAYLLFYILAKISKKVYLFHIIQIFGSIIIVNLYMCAFYYA